MEKHVKMYVFQGHDNIIVQCVCILFCQTRKCET